MMIRVEVARIHPTAACVRGQAIRRSYVECLEGGVAIASRTVDGCRVVGGRTSPTLAIDTFDLDGHIPPMYVKTSQSESPKVVVHVVGDWEWS